MTSDLGLVRNLSGLGLATGFNYIYLGHMTAGITIAFSLRYELYLNVLLYLVCSMVKKPPNPVRLRKKTSLIT